MREYLHNFLSREKKKDKVEQMSKEKILEILNSCLHNLERIESLSSNRTILLEVSSLKKKIKDLKQVF